MVIILTLTFIQGHTDVLNVWLFHKRLKQCPSNLLCNIPDKISAMAFKLGMMVDMHGIHTQAYFHDLDLDFEKIEKLILLVVWHIDIYDQFSKGSGTCQEATTVVKGLKGELHILYVARGFLTPLVTPGPFLPSCLGLMWLSHTVTLCFVLSQNLPWACTVYCSQAP